MRPTITTQYRDCEYKIARDMLKDILAPCGFFSKDGDTTKKILYLETEEIVKQKLYENFLRLKDIHKEEEGVEGFLTISNDSTLLTYKGIKASLVYQL